MARPVLFASPAFVADTRWQLTLWQHTAPLTAAERAVCGEEFQDLDGTAMRAARRILDARRVAMVGTRRAA